MKLRLTDLHLGFNKKRYHFKSNDLPDKGITFIEDQIYCDLSSKKNKNGYSISGELLAKTECECVRCLDKNIIEHALIINFYLVKEKKIENMNEDIDSISFNENQEEIEIDDLLTDLIGLAEPLKPLCSDACKGLCSVCGNNKNSKTCSCTIPQRNTVWDELKKIKIK